MTVLALCAMACGVTASAKAASAVIDGVAITFETVGTGFDRPVGLMPLPGDGRLLVVGKSGRVQFLEQGKPGAVFLDIADRVSNDNEQGLLGLAFDPGFAQNGKLYVDYTDTRGDTQIASFVAKGGRVDMATAKLLLKIERPEPNHNGGWIAFGPDGLLYIAMGDGGGAGDRHGQIGNGQDKAVPLGKILRIDPKGGDPYAIPAGNPFANGGGAPEVFLYGVRNPWRNAFDGDTFYIADVGQDKWEEIDVLDLKTAAGANLGWRVTEGNDCYNPRNCSTDGIVMPAHVYSHDEGCSITGGLVYRGKALPALAGRYFFADYCSGVIEGLRYEGGKATSLVTTRDTLGGIGNVTSFGTDADGELYVLTDDATVLKMVPAQ